jgi:type VI protein secretion system component Hcp
MLGENDPRREVVLGSRLMFGNSFLGSIHGYKFEDLNGDGDDENGQDPRMPGVEFVVRGPTDDDNIQIDPVITFQATTNERGEFWFTGLRPGTYTVRELLLDGSVATTYSSVTVTVRSGEELVAFAGQAMLGPNDPQHEVVLGDRLKFGNAFPGSIHGFKFEDRDGDGVYDREPCVVPDQGIGTVPVFDPNCVYSASDRNVAALDDILVVRQLESASPQLFRDAMGGRQEKFDGKITIQFRPNETQPARFLQFELKEVLVSGFTTSQSGGGGTERPMESLSLNFTKIEFRLPPGDPDFDLLRITAGSDFGLPSPGHTTLTQLPGGNWNVDSFFDITYRIDFAGTPGGVLGGRSGSTTGTIRMMSGNPARPPEPPIAGVEVTLHGNDFRGQPVTRTDVTNRHGEFWFLDLLPGTYSVTETQPATSIATTPTTAGPFQLLSRQELVALGGQAMLDPADPQVEVLVGRPLMFGNAYLGSIHGHKFEDLNGDGDDENGNDPRLGGVRITLTGVDILNHTIAPVTTTTDSRGEYWFMGLVPGRYTITETPPASTQATRPTSVQVTVSSGDELVAVAGQAHLPPNSVQHEIVLGPQLTFGNRYTALDFGDAPDPKFPTLYASNGARHIVRQGFFLGSRVDTESNGQPNAGATGDDTNGLDDEDGVAINGALQNGKPKKIVVVASAAGFLDGWIDFNSDGDWSDAGERIFNHQSLGAGKNGLTIAVPATVVSNQTALARFRFSSAGGLTPSGLATDGEVEDYTVQVVQRGRSAARGRAAAAIVRSFVDQQSGAASGTDRNSASRSPGPVANLDRSVRRAHAVAVDKLLTDDQFLWTTAASVANAEAPAPARHAIDDVLGELDWNSAGFQHLEAIIGRLI